MKAHVRRTLCLGIIIVAQYHFSVASPLGHQRQAFGEVTEPSTTTVFNENPSEASDTVSHIPEAPGPVGSVNTPDLSVSSTNKPGSLIGSKPSSDKLEPIGSESVSTLSTSTTEPSTSPTASSPPLPVDISDKDIFLPQTESSGCSGNNSDESDESSSSEENSDSSISTAEISSSSEEDSSSPSGCHCHKSSEENSSKSSSESEDSYSSSDSSESWEWEHHFYFYDDNKVKKK